MTQTTPTSTTRQRIARVNTQPKESKDYSAYVPVKIGSLKTAAYIDSGNTFANVISPETMTGLVYPLNICGPFLSQFGIDQLHSKRALLVQGKEVPMNRPSNRSLPPLQDGPNVCTL